LVHTLSYIKFQTGRAGCKPLGTDKNIINAKRKHSAACNRDH
jgi:hypothetical protein